MTDNDKTHPYFDDIQSKNGIYRLNTFFNYYKMNLFLIMQPYHLDSCSPIVIFQVHKWEMI